MNECHTITCKTPDVNVTCQHYMASWLILPGGYYQTAGADPAIKLRMKEDYDGAEPAASSIAAHNLIRLAALLPGSDSSKISKSAAVAADTQRQAGSSSAGGDLLGYLDRVDKMLAGFGGRLQHMVVAMPQMCCAAYLRTKVPLRQVGEGRGNAL